MTTYNTGNPIGSKDPRDLYDNAENLDTAVNDVENDTWKDRFGRTRKTMSGMERQFDAAEDYREATFDLTQADREARFNMFLESSGYQFLGDYAAGIEITEYNQIVRDPNGEFWRLSGQVELPYTTTGAGLPEDGALTPVGDAVLRQELSSPGKGAAMVARGVVAVDSIADLLALPENQRKEGLRYLVKGYHAGTGVGGGEFYWDAGSVDDPIAGMVLTTDPLVEGRFIRLVGSSVCATDFGAVGDGITDNADALQAAVDFCVARRITLRIPSGNFVTTQPIKILALNYANAIEIIGAGSGNAGTMITKIGTAKATGIPTIDTGYGIVDPNVDAVFIIAPVDGVGEVKFVHIRGLTILGDSDTDEDKYGIYYPFGSKFIFSDIRTYQTGHSGFFTYVIWNCSFTRCEFNQALYGFYVSRHPDGHIIAGTSVVMNTCGAVDFSREGFHITGLMYSTFSGCFVENIDPLLRESPTNGWSFTRCRGISVISPGTEKTLFKKGLFYVRDGSITVMSPTGYAIPNQSGLDDAALYYAEEGGYIKVEDHGFILDQNRSDGIRPIIAKDTSRVTLNSIRFNMNEITGRAPFTESGTLAGINITKTDEFRQLGGVIQSELLGVSSDVYANRNLYPGGELSGVSTLTGAPTPIFKVRQYNLAARQVFAIEVSGLSVNLNEEGGCRAVDDILISLTGLGTPTIKIGRRSSLVMGDEARSEYTLSVSSEVVDGVMTEFTVSAAMGPVWDGINGHIRFNAKVHSSVARPYPI